MATNGAACIKAVETLKADPDKTFPASSYTEPSTEVGLAVQEAIVTRTPKRCDHRLKAYGDELSAQTKSMAFSFDKLPKAFDDAFAQVKSWMDYLTDLAPKSIDGARDSSLSQLRTMVKQLRAAILSGQSRTEKALVGQQDMARKQLSGSHRARARAEAMSESKRAERDITALRALALSQGASVKVIVENLRRERGRGEKELARQTIAMARGFAARVATTDSTQRPKLVALDRRDGGARQAVADDRRQPRRAERSMWKQFAKVARRSGRDSTVRPTNLDGSPSSRGRCPTRSKIFAEDPRRDGRGPEEARRAVNATDTGSKTMTGTKSNDGGGGIRGGRKAA